MNVELAGRGKPSPDKLKRMLTQDHDHPTPSAVEIGLTAAIVAVLDNEPVALIVRAEPDSGGATDGLPSGPFEPRQHRTLEGGLRSWVNEQADLDLGYAEQLYTFADRGRQPEQNDDKPPVVSIGYLALTQARGGAELSSGTWRPWYHYFPWEDWRRGRPDIIAAEIEPRLKAWAERQPGLTAAQRPIAQAERIRICFGLDGTAWDEEKVLERYELLYEAGLVEEARRDGRALT